MTNTNKKLLLLLVVQVVLMMGIRMSSDAKLDYTTVTLMPDLDVDKVTGIEVFGPPKDGDGPTQDSVALSKENGTWGITNADRFPVDATKVKEALAALKGMTSRTRVLESSTYHDKLEVSAKKYQRKITIKSGDATKVIYVGSAESFKNVHVRIDGSDQVYLVNDFNTADIGDRAWHWVEREYVNIAKDKVWAVKIANAKGSLELEKNPLDSKWAALGISEPLDTTVVDDLVRKATSMNLDTPVGKTIKPEYGFDAPLATISLITGTSTIAGTPPPTTETQSIQIGKKLEKENQYYVKASTSAYVVRVPSYAIDPLVNKARADLIKKPEPEKK